MIRKDIWCMCLGKMNKKRSHNFMCGSKLEEKIFRITIGEIK